MIKDNYIDIKNRVMKAAANCIDQHDVKLIAVSKMHSADEILEVYQEGQRDFGENKVQELLEKFEVLPKDINWHMIGHLQTNKVKYIIDKVCLIHSVDSLKLAEVIDKEAKKHNIIMQVLLEVNIGHESSKSGIDPDGLIDLVIDASKLSNIKIIGLMCIPPVSDDSMVSRNYFRALKELSIDINNRNIDNVKMNTLSMGMSDDFEEAISEGSNFVRIGTSIFGMRDYSK